MRSVCCECGLLYDVKPPLDNDAETHGLCDGCFEITMRNIKARRNKVRAEYKRQYHTLEII